ncbi:ATP-grasp domain-containing protein [Tribonema minus]|uniref:ATP-grasp domain-containing protein n=1 Tax=Tribonema minus TaxID=303371 RepID=A0A835ZA87_9STRA|nr:ATP-grasp domain-containing protein [Tribonema minus]
MNEALRSAGMRAVRQCKARSWPDVAAFSAALAAAAGARDDRWAPLVIKPLRGCASGDVFLCATEVEARNALDTIVGSPLYATPGAVNREALVQDFLEGVEYVVDTVSCKGAHKAMAVWRYDKRPANGAPFVYHATELRAASGREEGAVVAYAMQALDALGVRIGTAHIEVMLTRDGPRLIEYNGRWHLTDFRELCNDCVGYNAIDATVDAYLDHEAFDALPPAPLKLAAAGRVVHLVCHTAGTVAAVRHGAAIRALRSFRAMDVYGAFGVGQRVSPTIDIRSDAGWVHLSHADAHVVEEDYRALVALMPTMFEVEVDA